MSQGLKFVFCEGGDDLAVVRGVAESIGLLDFRIERFLGKDRLTEFLSDVRKRPEFVQENVASVAVVRDADEDLNAAFTSVRHSLTTNGFTPCPDHNGQIAGTSRRIGILIIGPNQGKGMIEDLCLQSVSDRPEFGCVDDYLRCIADKCDRRSFSSKGKIRIWMGSHSDHDLYVGCAAAKGYWPWENASFDPLKAFLRAL